MDNLEIRRDPPFGSAGARSWPLQGQRMRTKLAGLRCGRIPQQVETVYTVHHARVTLRWLRVINPKFWNASEPLGNKYAHLYPRQVRAKATVNAGAEGQSRSLAVEIELEWIFIDRTVEIAGRQQ